MKKTQYTSEYEAMSRKTSGSSYLRTFLIFFLVALVIATAVMIPIRNWGKAIEDDPIFGEVETRLIDEMEPIAGTDSPFYEAFQDAERVNVLILGVNDGLSDTIMVASYDMATQRVDLISIPRDTYYYQEGKTGAAWFKINSIYGGKNVLNTAKAVSEVLLGMPLHYYAICDYKGIENIVNSMGGIPIYVKQDMQYKDLSDNPPLIIDIKKGQQVLDGAHAVQYLRFRSGYSNGDIGRVEAQQEFMKAAFKQMLSFELPKIAKTVTENVETDITWGMTLKVVSSAINLSSENFHTHMMPNTKQGEAPWYVYPDSEGIAELIREIYSVEPEPEDGEGTGEGGEGGSDAGQGE